MYDDTVDCPYCGYENDMLDALCDGLSDDNKLDWTCQNCEEEFEVKVEFNPSYSASKIIYEKCDECGKETRDIYHDKRIFPFPEKLKGKRLCYQCWLKGVTEEF
jgi:transposase-like protein